MVEPGKSSEAVIEALASAARRGVKLRLRTDRSEENQSDVLEAPKCFYMLDSIK